MAESAFSEDGKYFSAISHDGRLRIWDTETNVLLQEYTPDLHLSSPPTCLLWLYLANSETPRKGKRKSHSEDESQCIALGTTIGKILIYSVSQANIEIVLHDNRNSGTHGHAITALDWHRKYGLYSCNKGGFVQEWDIRSAMCRNKYNVLAESKNKQASNVSAISIIPHNQNTPSRYLATASWQIQVWRLLDEEATVIMALGHTGAQRPLLQLVALNQKSWLVSGSQNERLLSFWDVSITEDHVPQTNGTDLPAKKSRKKVSLDGPTVVPTPMYSFVLEDAPKAVSVNFKVADVISLELAAATRSGVVHYYGHTLNGSSIKPIKPSVTLQVATADARPLPLVGCRLGRGGAVLGYQDAARTVFERLIPNTKNKTQILIRGESKPQSKQKEKDIVNKVRGSDGDAKVTYVEPLGGVARKRATPGAKIEVPMESRLENLSVDPKKRNKWAVCQNLTKLLIQGLHSKDKNLIHTVIQNNDPLVALRTAAALPPFYVPLLLDQLADFSAGKTSVCASVCTWLSALLRSQAALLLAALPGARGDRLAQMLATFTQRRSHLCQLLNLKGRLELTSSQRAAPPAAVEEQAVLEYNDESSSDEMELHHSESESLDEFDSDRQENDNDMDEDD